MVSITQNTSIEYHHHESQQSIFVPKGFANECYNLRIELRWRSLPEVIDIDWWGWAGSFTISGIRR